MNATGPGPTPTSPSNIDELDCVHSLFQQPWWLNAVAPGQWDAVSVEENGRTVARWPFRIKQRYGLTVLSQPELTKTLGPWLAVENLDHYDRLSRERELLPQLVAKLPRYDLLTQGFCPELTNWLPLYWQGFRQSTYYTYRIHDLSNLDRLFKSLYSKTRYNIRRAEKTLSVRHDLGVDTLLTMVHKTFDRKQASVFVSDDVVRRAVAGCEAKQACRMFFAEDATGAVHAALLLVYDRYCAYYLMGGIAPQYANFHGMSLLMWRAIEYAAGVSQIFDFEGSMNEDIERFFRRFGSQQTPYFFISHMTRRLTWLDRVRRRLP